MWALAILVSLPAPDTVTTRVDIVEINHYHDDNGRLVFTQIIGWTAEVEDGILLFHAQWWRMWKRDYLPHRDYARGDWRVIFSEGDTIHRVIFSEYRETWTQVDPELRDRQFHPVEKRKGLGRGANASDVPTR